MQVLEQVRYKGQEESQGVNMNRVCDCGSGEYSEWEHDYHGIELCRACSKCRKRKLAKFRPEVINGYSQSDMDEPIEPEE